jgi:hypothetical protein
VFEDSVFAKYSMTVDILKLQAVQDPDSGRIVKEWVFVENAQCYAQTIESNKASDTEAGSKVRRVYSQHEVITVKIPNDINNRCRLTNFRTRSGALMWKESEFIGEVPTVFEINSVEPVIDMFGDILEYQIQAHRIEVQNVS